MNGLSEKQALALEVLRYRGALRPSELGEALGTSAQGAAMTAASLVRRGLVVRDTQSLPLRYRAA